MKISLLLLALVTGSIAANIDDSSGRNEAAKKLDELDQELHEVLIEDDDDEEEDEFDEEEEDEEQSSLINSLTFLQGRQLVYSTFCKAKGGCKKQGGECVTAPFADNCKAIHGDAGKLKKNACKSKDCQCCVPPPTCDGKVKKSCSKNGGYCVLKPFKANCKGGTLNKKSCKSKHCQCCTPATTGGTGGNKDTTVKPETTVENKQQTTGRPTTTQPPVQTTTLPPQTTTPPPPPPTIHIDPTTTPAKTTTPPPPPTTTPPHPPTTTPPAPTTTPPQPTTTPPQPTTTPPPPTTTPPPPPTTLPNDPPTTPAKTTTPPPPPTTTAPPPPTTTPPPPTTTPPQPTTTPPRPTTTPPPPTTTPPPPTTTPPPPTTTPAPPTTTPPPPTTTQPPPTTQAIPKDNLLPGVVIRDENLEWTQGWFSKKRVTYTLVLARGYGNEEEFIYIQKDKFNSGYTLDTLIDICDLQYGTYEINNGRKGVFMVYHDTELKPYQKRFKLNTDGITQDILNAVGETIDSENFPGTSTSNSFWSFSWLTGDYLKDVDC